MHIKQKTAASVPQAMQFGYPIECAILKPRDPGEGCNHVSIHADGIAAAVAAAATASATVAENVSGLAFLATDPCGLLML